MTQSYVEAEIDGKRLTKAQREEKVRENMDYLRKLMGGITRVFAVKLPFEKGVRGPRWRLFIVTDDPQDGLMLREISSVVHNAAGMQWDDKRDAIIGDPYDTQARPIQQWFRRTWPDVRVIKV
jgi:hypothetical protein